MIGAAQAVWVIARKEVMEHIRSKRIYFIGGFFFATFLAASILGAIFVGRDGFFGTVGSGEAIAQILLLYFSVGLLGGFAFTSVLAIALSADAVCGEWKDRTLFLLLSKPITRGAMLGGKVLGAYLSVAGVFSVVSAICLALLVILLGWPDAASWARILGGFGIVLAGLLPFVSVGVLCSTLFRSPVSSFVVALALWFLVFPLLGSIGFFIELAQQVPFEDLGTTPLARLFSLLSPSALLQAAGLVWMGSGGDGFSFQSTGLPDNPAYVLMAMGVHTAVYIGLSYVIVRRRDYA